MTAFLRFSQRMDHQFFQPDIPGPVGRKRNGNIHVFDQNASAGYTWTLSPNSLLEARFGFSRIKGRQDSAESGPCDQLSGVSLFRLADDARPSRRPEFPEHQRLLSIGPANEQSAIPESHVVRSEDQLFADPRPPLDQDGLRVPGDPHRSARRESALRRGSVHRRIQQAHLRSIGTGGRMHGYQRLHELQSRGFYLRHAQHHQSRAPISSINLRQHVHSLYVQDDYRVTSKLTVNAGLRWDFATPLYDRDNNWSNFSPATDTMIPATGGSLYNRSPGTSQLQGFWPAARLSLQHRHQDGGSKRLRHQLHILQPPRQLRRRHQRPQRPFRRNQPIDSRGRAGTGGLPHDAEQLYDGHRQPRSFQSGQFQRGLHSGAQPVALRAKLVLVGAARTSHEHVGRGGLQRQPQPGSSHSRRLQPGEP